MKSEEIFEMFNDIDDSFVDAAFPNAEKSEVVQPQEIHMTKRRLPWGIAAAAAACLAVCAAVGAVIAVNTGKSKIPVESNSPLQSGLNAIAAECVFDSSDYGQTDDKPYPEIKEMFCEFTMDEYPELTFRVIRLSGGEGGPTLYCVEEGVEYRLLSGHQIYLCDFDSDGKREICLNRSIGSGIVHKLVLGYDPEDRTAYYYDSHFSSDNEEQCRLIIVDGVLKVQVSPAWCYTPEIWEADDVEIRPLELVKSETLTVYNSVTEYGDELTIQVKPSKFEYKVGEMIPVDVEITNVSGRPIYLYQGFQAMYNDGTSDEDKYYIVDGNITRNDLSLENKSHPFIGNDAIYTLQLEQGETYTARLNFEATAGENTPFGMYQGVITVATAFDPHYYESLTTHTVKFPIRISDSKLVTPDDSGVSTEPNTPEDPGESTEPEPLYSFFENDKLRLQVDLEKSAYKKGDIITVDAEVTNKSDKKFYIFVPTATADTHTEIRTYISLDGRRLNDIDAVQYWDDAITLIPLEPGESFTLKKVRFDTTYTGDESLGISKQPVQSGIYQGTTEITIMESTDFQTPAESYYTSFAIEIM
ncbi:MAG: hypothetical protein HDT42_01125 [Ruminococcaceae bacterium]|nr:hypothetical protein [Oscillospiraceae bacterium]